MRNLAGTMRKPALRITENPSQIASKANPIAVLFAASARKLPPAR